MSKKIFTSGYFSMRRVVEMLVADGHEVYRAYEDDIEGTKFVDFKLGGVSAEAMKAEGYHDYINFLLSNLTIGGKSIGNSEQAAAGIAAWVIKAVWNRKLLVKSMESLGDLDAVIVHNDFDPTYGAITLWAQRKGIPVFCLYNGFSSFLHPKHTSFLNFRMGSNYCMNGEYDLEYVTTRKIEPIEGVLTGCTSWDDYYTVDKKREPNTFLYNVTTNYEEIDAREDLVNVHPTALHPWTFHYRPSTIDKTFFAAFARYQKNANPEAKLIITMRPYHILSHSFANLQSNHGINNVTVCESANKPFRELIQECEYFISGISTTVQEAIVTRTPTVFLCGNEPADDFFKGRDCYVESVIKEDAIVEALHYITSVKSELVEACDSRASYYNYGDDGKASERAFLHIKEEIA